MGMRTYIFLPQGGTLTANLVYSAIAATLLFLSEVVDAHNVDLLDVPTVRQLVYKSNNLSTPETVLGYFGRIESVTIDALESIDRFVEEYNLDEQVKEEYWESRYMGCILYQSTRARPARLS
jgi:hypothetical protein